MIVPLVKLLIQESMIKNFKNINLSKFDFEIHFLTNIMKKTCMFYSITPCQAKIGDAESMRVCRKMCSG